MSLYLLRGGNTEQPESGAEHSGRQVAQHEARLRLLWRVGPQDRASLVEAAEDLGQFKQVGAESVWFVRLDARRDRGVGSPS